MSFSHVCIGAFLMTVIVHFGHGRANPHSCLSSVAVFSDTLHLIKQHLHISTSPESAKAKISQQ